MADSVDKPTLRRRLRGVRDAISPAQRASWSRAIAQGVLTLPEVAAAESVFCYVSVGAEVDTRELLQRLLDAGRRVAVPRIGDGGLMQAHLVTSLADLAPGPYGIPTPRPGTPILAAPAVTIVPGLAFTPAGDRLGLGAGYYDRWLAAHPRTFSVGLCFPPLLRDDLPVEPHDQRVGRVIAPGCSPGR